MREFSSGSTNYPQIIFFLFVLITYLVDIVLILYGEILSWSLVGVKVLKNRNRDPITIEKILLLNCIKQIYFVLLWVCSVVNHRKCQNRVRTKYGQLAAPCVPLFRCIGELCLLVMYIPWSFVLLWYEFQGSYYLICLSTQGCSPNKTVAKWCLMTDIIDLS